MRVVAFVIAALFFLGFTVKPKDKVLIFSLTKGFHHASIADNHMLGRVVPAWGAWLVALAVVNGAEHLCIVHVARQHEVHLVLVEQTFELCEIRISGHVPVHGAVERHNHCTKEVTGCAKGVGIGGAKATYATV